MKNDWNVTVATPADFDLWMDFVSTVQEEFHRLDLANDPNYRSVIKKNNARGTALYVKDPASGEIIGAMIYSTKSNHIGWLAVSPKKRRLGIGTKLVEYMYRKFPEDIHIKVKTFLITDIPGVAAQSFYRSMNFQAGQIEKDTAGNNGGHPFQVFWNRSRAPE